MRQSCKRDIQRAVIDLIAEEPLEHITVTEVTQRAGVSRTSYYRHYHTLQNVIDDFFSELDEELSSIVTLRGEDSVGDGAIPVCDLPLYELLEHYHEYSNDLGIILRSDLRSSAMERIHNRVYSLLASDEVLPDAFHIEDERERGQLVHYIAGGMTGLICTWIMEGCATDSRELLMFILRLHNLKVA